MQVEQWLSDIGMGQYIEAFRRERITFDVVPFLTSEDLKKLGVRTLGDRKRLLLAISHQRPLRPTTRADDGPGSDERRVVTILFVDLTDYTGWSTRLDPEDFSYLQRRFWTVMGDIVASHGGTLKNRPGDALAAVFGFPVAHGNDAIRASAAAVEMHAAMGPLSDEISDALGVGRPLEVHIGIAIGEAYTGPPDPEFDEYYVLGEYLNLASRLSDAAAPGETLISEQVYQTIREFAACGPPTDHHLRGFPAPIRARVLRAMDPSRPDYSGLPFVGRADLVRRLVGSLQHCVSNHRGRAALVTGGPGLGKSRTVHELEQRAREMRFAVHRICIQDFGARTYLAPIRFLATRLLNVPSSVGRATRRQIVDQLFLGGRMRPELRVFTNDLLDVAQPAELSEQFDAMDPATRKRGRLDAFCELVIQATKRHPTLIVFEDVHWADDESLAAITALARSIADQPLLLVLTLRCEPDEALPLRGLGPALLPDLQIESLEPLSAQESEALARALMDSSPDLIDETATRSRGNPFFLVQLAHQSGDGAASRLPESIRELIQGRLDRLPPTDREVLQTASVLGQRFRLDVLARLMAGDTVVPDTLLAHSFVRRLGDEFEFDHDLLRTCVYDSLPRPRRSALHLKAARILGEASPSLRARHLDLAGDPGAAAAYYDAAEELFFASEFSAALELVARGLAKATDTRIRTELLQMKGEIQGRLGRYEEACETFEALNGCSDDLAIRCLSLINASENLSRLDRFPEALESLREAESIAGSLGSDKLSSDIHYRRGEISYMLSDFDECLSNHEKAYELAARAESSESLSRAYQGLGFVHYQRGRILTSQVLFRRCIEEARRAGDHRRAAQILHMTAYGHYVNLELQTALRIGEEAIESGRRIGCPRTMMNSSRLCGYVLFELGYLAEAESVLRESLEIVEQINARRFDPIVRAMLGRVFLASGRESLAEELAEEAWSSSLGNNASYMGPAVLGTLALASRSERRQDWALEQGLQILAGSSPSHNHLWFHRDAMMLGVRRGEADRVERHARMLDAFCREERLPWAEFHVAKSTALVRAGRARGAEAQRDRLLQLRRVASDAGLGLDLREINDVLKAVYDWSPG